MEMVTISKEEFEGMKSELDDLRGKIKDITGDSQEETDVVDQLKASLEDLRHGRITRVA